MLKNAFAYVTRKSLKSIIYVILFMSLVLIISLVLSSISSLKKNPKELLIDTK